MLHNELAEQGEGWVEIITCAEPVLGTSLQTPGAQIPLSQKHLFQKLHATACLPGAAPADLFCSACLRAQAWLLPRSAAGPGCPVCFAGYPSAGSPAHQSLARTLAAHPSSSCPVCGCLAWGVKTQGFFFLGCDLQPLLCVIAADPEHVLRENWSQSAGVAELLCQGRAGVPDG